MEANERCTIFLCRFLSLRKKNGLFIYCVLLRGRSDKNIIQFITQALNYIKKGTTSVIVFTIDVLGPIANLNALVEVKVGRTNEEIRNIVGALIKVLAVCWIAKQSIPVGADKPFRRLSCGFNCWASRGCLRRSGSS